MENQKKKIVKVIFTRAEGPPKECVRKEFASTEAAQIQALRWARTAPAPHKGYNKCDFTLVFEDGMEYNGRYDLQNTGYNSDGETIIQQASRFLKYMAGIARPLHMTDDRWESVLEDHERNGHKRQALEFLETYDLSNT